MSSEYRKEGYPAYKNPVVVPVSLYCVRAPAHLDYPGLKDRKNGCCCYYYYYYYYLRFEHAVVLEGNMQDVDCLFCVVCRSVYLPQQQTARVPLVRSEKVSQSRRRLCRPSAMVPQHLPAAAATLPRQRSSTHADDTLLLLATARQQASTVF